VFVYAGQPRRRVMNKRVARFVGAGITSENGHKYYISGYGLIVACIDTLEKRREVLTKRFFRTTVMPQSSCLSYLLPADKRDSDILNKLRCPKIFQPLRVNTVRLTCRKSLLPYCLDNF